MPLAKPRSPSLQLSHRLAEGLVGAWVMPEGAGLRSRDSSPARLDTTFTGSPVPTWTVGPTGPVIVYGNNGYSLLLVNTAPASVPASLGTIGAVGSAYTIVSRILTTNALAIGATALWSFGGCLFEARNTGASTLAHAWSVGVESGKWGTARTNNVGAATGQRIVSVASVNNNVWHDVAAVVNGNAVSLYIDGQLDTAATFNLANSTADCSVGTGTGNVYAEIAARSTNVSGYASALTGSVAYCYVYTRALSRDEISALAADAFVMFRAPSRPWLAPTVPSTNGVLDTTLQPVTLDAIGTLPIASTVLATLAPATLSATGAATAHGALSATLTPATLAATGALQVMRSGALDVALQSAVLSATGAATAHGTLSATLTPATLDAAGTLTLSGETAVTLRAATLDAVGALALTGGVTATLQEAALDAVAALAVTGDLQTALLPATLEATAIVLAGLIGERAEIVGSRAPVVALTGGPSLAAIAGSRRRPVALVGNSEMVTA